MLPYGGRDDKLWLHETFPFLYGAVSLLIINTVKSKK